MSWVVEWVKMPNAFHGKCEVPSKTEFENRLCEFKKEIVDGILDNNEWRNDLNIKSHFNHWYPVRMQSLIGETEHRLRTEVIGHLTRIDQRLSVIEGRISDLEGQKQSISDVSRKIITEVKASIAEEVIHLRNVVAASKGSDA